MNDTCAGTLIWYDVEPDDGRNWPTAAVLLCSTCGAVFTTGQPLDAAHAEPELLREGLGGGQ